MQIKVNGNIQDFDEDRLSITQLLQKMSYTSPCIIVKFKGETIKREDFEQVFLIDQDEILVIHIFAGG